MFNNNVKKESNDNFKVYFEKIYRKSSKDYYKDLKQILLENKKKFIITANPETITYAQTDSEMSKMLLDKKVSIVPDGIGIVKAANILNYNIKERITGIDIAVKLLEYCNSYGKSLYLFGAKQETIEAMVKTVEKKYPNIELLGVTNGYVKDKDSVMEHISALNPDVTMLALGIPLQEKLIYKHLNKFKTGIFIGVGGSFDVISGIKKRAPKFFIKTNTEWLYRIICEPKRIKRFYNNNIKFLIKVKRLENEK